MTPSHALRCLLGVCYREHVRFLNQRSRFFSALVRPLLWLLVFAVGFGQLQSPLSTPPYASPVSYETYIVPGLVMVIQLFNGMQSSFSMVYDREMGAMRVLLISPVPRGYVLFCKLLAGTIISLPQVYAFLLIAYVAGVELPLSGYVLLFPVLIITGLMLGALGLFLSSVVHQLENFAGIMNFVIFPMFFLSPALYPLARMRDGHEVLYILSQLNPFTHAVEFGRFAIYGDVAPVAAGVTLLALLVFLAAAILSYKPARTR